MKNLLHLLIAAPFFLAAIPLSAQIELKVQLQPDAKTYTVFARSQVDFLPPLDHLTHSAQVTLVVPGGAFQIANLQSHAGQWQLTSLIAQPIENPGADYAVFSLTAPTSDATFVAGQEVPLFSFENENGCTGAVEIMDPFADPFLPPNSLNVPVGQEFFVEGAGGDAYVGNYAPGSANCFFNANCLIAFELELLPDGFYQVSILPDDVLAAPSTVEMLQVAVKVPTGFFKAHNLENLLSGTMSFSSVTRFDHPAEDEDFDYLQFRMDAAGGGLPIQPGVAVPVLKFANGGSCQGDSVFLVKNDDPFLPPNSLAAGIGPLAKFSGGHPVAACAGSSAAAPCEGCLFTGDILKIDSLLAVDPAACLGGADGIIRIFAHGASLLEFSIDGGLTWSADSYFGGLEAGSYTPAVRSTHLGCPVAATGSQLELEPGTTIELHLDVPQHACEGETLPLKIMSPSPLPPDAAYQWTGPSGFSAAIADPVIFDLKNFQSGTYTLAMISPGCDPANASVNLQVHDAPPKPDIFTAGAFCFGEKLELSTDAVAEKFEWLSPIGSGSATLALPGLTTLENFTKIPDNHPAYASGNWRVRVTDTHGCTATSEAAAVTIKQRPQAFAENSGPACPGSAVQLLGNPLPGAVYQWKIQGETDVFSMQPNPVVGAVFAPQTFELQVVQNGCVSTNPSFTTVAVSPAPSLSPTYEYQPAADCSPADLELAANAAGDGLNFAWTGPGGFASQAENPVLPNASATANGSYQLEVTNVFGCTASQTLQVPDVPDPVVTPVVQSTGPACPGEDVALEIQIYNEPQVSYQWYRNGSPLFGQTSNVLNISAVQTANAGNYHVKVNVGDCVVESAPVPVTVLGSPIAAPDFYLSTPCEGGTLQFFSNQNGNTAWHWTGPGGFVSDSPNPVIYNAAFADIGSYSLTVTGSNGCQTSASIVVDGILPVPAAPQVASNSPVCPEGEILLTVQNPVTTGSVSYQWFNGLGDPVGTGSATLTLAADDPQAVSPFLVKTTVNTCPSPLSNPVPVEVLPMPVAMASNGGAICSGESAQLFAAGVPNGSYEWRVAGQPQVVSIEQNPVLTLTDSTDFQLIVTANGCMSEAVAFTSVPVHPAPEITGLTGGGAHCEGSPATFSAGNGTPLSAPVQFVWQGPGGFNFTGVASPQGPFELSFGSVTAQNEGAYTLTLTSAEGCVSASESVLLEVGEMPPVPLLNVADAVLCQGETLQLDASPATGNSVEYRWFFNDGSADFLLASSGFPTYFLPGVMPSNSGTYFVKTTVDGCEPPPSNLVPVTVLGQATSVQASNSTTSLTPVCEGADVQLDATLIPGAGYHWFGPAGFFADISNPLLEGVTASQAGSYLVLVSLPDCPLTVTASTTVFVQEAPEVPVLTGSFEACEGTEAEIAVANAEAGAVYDFYFGQNTQPLASGPGASLVLENVEPAQSGGYFAVATLNGCPSAASGIFQLEVIPTQTGAAFAGSDQVVCEAGEIPLLQAMPPATGSGAWTSLDGAAVVQPWLAISPVLGLQPGPNRFVWTLSNGICPGAGVDTAVIFLEKIAVSGENFIVDPGANLLDVNLLENDLTENVAAWEFFILKKPKKGKLLDDGSGVVSYEPYPHASGEDEFTYQLCSMTCPEVCDTATVRLSFSGPTAENCFTPNLVTPNGDGENDTFVIPCAADWPGSSLSIFNRWGSVVFTSKNYENDWDGTSDGQPLPVGTYFFQLTLNDGNDTLLQGYVAVMR